MAYRAARFRAINLGRTLPKPPFHGLRGRLMLDRLQSTPIRKGAPAFDNTFQDRRTWYGYPETHRMHDGFCSAAGRRI